MSDSSVDAAIRSFNGGVCDALFHSPSQAVMVVQDMQVVLCNEATERIVGYSAEEFKELGGDSLTRIIHPDSRATVLERYQQRMAGEASPDPYEVHIITKSGEDRWVEACPSLITYEGRPAVLVPFVDITERVQAIRKLTVDGDGLCQANGDPRDDGAVNREQLAHRVEERTSELADANAYMSTLLETSHDGILVVDAEGKFEYGNEAFFRTFGWPRDELIGASFLKVIPEDLVEYMMERWAEVQAGEGKPYETEIVHKNGDRHALLVSHRHMTIAGQRKYCVVTKDITDKKRDERELQAHRERLEELVAERTAELEQRSGELARLAEKLTLVEHHERQKVAQYLHDDLQQLLVGARLQVRAMASFEGAQRTEALAKLTDVLTEAIETARDVIQDTAPPVALKREPAEGFEWIVRDARKRYQLEVESRVEIGEALNDAPEAITVLLFTAARELLLNVVKHAETPRATLRLAQDDGSVVLEVSDEGRGFAPSGVERKDTFGLFSIRERAELLGGSFELDSTPGSGVRIRLSVPLPEVSTPMPADGPPRIWLASGREPDGLRSREGSPDAVRVLFVDDHPIVRESLANLLGMHAGIDVVGQADNGREAVKCVERLQPDVVVMDVSMPVMDGVEATRIIKSRWPDTKVIGLSMFDESERGARMREADADDYVSKSAPPEQLIEAIYACMPVPGDQAE